MTVDPAYTETVYKIGGLSGLGPYATVWPYEDPTTVQVYLNQGEGPVLVAPSSYVVTGSPSGLPSIFSGGNITLAQALLDGAATWPVGTTLILDRNTAQGQPSALGEAIGFDPAAYEAALDHVTRQLEETETLALRAIQGQPGERLIALPAAAQRAGMLLGFDPVTGQPFPQEVGFTVGDGQLLFPSLFLAQLATVPAGSLGLLTMGYATAGDGGGALYVYSATQPVDPGTWFQSADGAYWYLDPGQALNVRQFGAKADNVTDNIVPLQNAWNYIRKYGGRLRIPRGLPYRFTGPITVAMGAEQDFASIFEGDGYDADTALPYAGTTGSTLFNISTTQPAFIQHGSPTGSNANQDGTIVYRDFAVIGDGVQVAGGHGWDGAYMNNTLFDGMFIAYHRGCGVYSKSGFDEHYRNNLIFQNFSWGLQFDSAANNVMLEKNRCFSNGRDFTQFSQGNIGFTGAPHANQGPILRANDVSYGGNGALYSVTAGTLVSISVTAGVATAYAPNHGRATGDYIGVLHSAVVHLDATYAQQVTATDVNHFTFATPAANGVYANGAMIISSYAYGLFCQGNTGMVVDGFYCEDSPGFGAYLSSTCDGFAFTGGFCYNSTIASDTAINGCFEGICFEGSGGLLINEINERSTIEQGLTNTYVISAAGETPALVTSVNFFLRGGRRYGNAVPTTGTWLAGEDLYFQRPASGSYAAYNQGWVCSVGGTPGTFVPFGNFELLGTVAYGVTLAAGALGAIQTITVTGALLGDVVQASYSADLMGVFLRGWVSAADTVKFVMNNPTAGSLTVAGNVLLRVHH